MPFLYVERNVVRACLTYVALNLIVHDLFSGKGRDAVIAELEPIWPMVVKYSISYYGFDAGM